MAEGGRLASRSSVPTEGKLASGQGEPPPRPIRKRQRFCQLRASPWSLAAGSPVSLKAHSQVSPCASPPGRSFKRIPTEHLLCARTPDGQVVKEAQGNHGRSHLESPSCKSPSGWPEAQGQGPGPLLVLSLLQRPLFQIRLMAPGSCASSGHRGFIPVNRKEESSSLTVLLALRWPN